MSNKKTFTLEALHGYVAPSVSVLACQNEGLLCASSVGSVVESPDWKEGQTGWFE